MAYVDLCEVRDEGIDEDIASDLKINLAIAKWCGFIDKYCNRWFEPRTLDTKLDGNGTKILHLGIPIITLTGLYINDSTTLLPVTEYHVYNQIGGMQDDRGNPKIVLKSSKFLQGYQNQRLVGSFGYVESDGSTPELIKYAALKLIIEKILNPIILTQDFEMNGVELNKDQGYTISETTDEHVKSFSHIKLETRRQGVAITRDYEILDILNSFKNSFNIEMIS